MNAHTPGPWKATYNKKFDWWTIHHTGQCNFGETSTVCHVKDFQPDHKEADAHLIAAAPDLIDALKAVFAPGGWTHADDCQCDVCVKVRAAIAKAEGRI